MDRRTNWKENLSKEAQERTKKKLALLDQLDATRAEMKSCGRDIEKHDALALRYRETVAKLATV